MPISHAQKPKDEIKNFARMGRVLRIRKLPDERPKESGIYLP